MLNKVLGQKALLTMLFVGVLLGGIFSYINIGKLEDAEIPLKTAMVITLYPGATAHEVELEVSNVLEEGIRKLENVDYIESQSESGISVIKVNIRNEVRTGKLPQLWDHLRRKVVDISPQLPAGAYTPIVNDDFADTYGMLYAVTSDGHSLPELHKYTEYIERELLAVPGVKRSQIFGMQDESIEVVFSEEKLAGMALNPMMIAQAMQARGEVANSGWVSVGTQSIRIDVGERLTSVKDLENLLLQMPAGGSFRLGDVATVRRSLFEPKRNAMHFNGKTALSLGLSNESNINVVKLGEKVESRLDELQNNLPAGIEVKTIYSQPARVEKSVDEFVLNLVMSVGIVIIVLLFAMGIRSGLLISSGLVFTILATLIAMNAIDLPLHRVTLAAIILAMGMLVDNSIVVADGILIDLKKGIKPEKAFTNTAVKTAWPLLAATLIAILAFFPLGVAPHPAGEFLSSLFTVLVISLLLSWIFAMVQTPFMAKYFYRKEAKGKDKESDDNVYDSALYQRLRRTVAWTLEHKKPFVLFCGAIVVLAMYGFQFVKMDFIPKTPYDQFIIEYTLDKGSDIKAVERDLYAAEGDIMKIDRVTAVTTAIGSTPARYTMLRPVMQGGSHYGEMIVETEELEDVPQVMEKARAYFNENFPQAKVRVMQYGAAFEDYPVEILISGPDPAVLRDLSVQVQDVLKKESIAKNVGDNLGNKTKKYIPNYDVKRAQASGLTRKDMAQSILVASTGMPIGLVHENDKQIPVLLKSTTTLDHDIESLGSLPVWGPRATASVPLGHIMDTVSLGWEDQLVFRRNGRRTVKVQCDIRDGHTGDELVANVKDKVSAIPFPDGYGLEWRGMVGSSKDANEALFKFLPLALGLMILIIVGLFNNLRQPLIIILMVPQALVGVAFGFLITGEFLNFMGTIGALGLIGMMIKNAIVLLDEIKLGIKEGKSQAQATIDASVSRMRPVMMASLTTILGMIPLLWDAMFISMAITIMFGLLVGSLITLFVVPALYAILYNVKLDVTSKG
ncbi:multidrug transporter AcrB (plasmid) [Fulvitalea axinellae]|uniref:Multidrug transporter AcrB n=1 Tax=Fulvitalea axinellae TaxID=1182444 RepID=A0AAU9DIU7_9BACT|nr:multidrug transporter AcrB [Fulvitalea axinellae]